MSDRLTLRAGALAVQLLPAVGGSIARFDHFGPAGRQPLLRGNDDAYRGPLDSACFPLVPFANRIRDGSFICDGRSVRLAANMAGDANPLHGQGWLARWTVVDIGEAHVELAYTHEPGEWPWAYEARQLIALDAAGLSIALSCRNLSDDRMPCGLGLHPYYPCDDTTLLETDVASAWTVDAAVLPVANVPATGRYDLRRRKVCGQGLDNGFDGWSGSARVTWPGRPTSLLLSSPNAERFQLYSPAAGGVFVAEPVQNANAALNEEQRRWPGLGIRLLAKGDTLRLEARFAVAAAS